MAWNHQLGVVAWLTGHPEEALAALREHWVPALRPPNPKSADGLYRVFARELCRRFGVKGWPPPDRPEGSG